MSNVVPIRPVEPSSDEVPESGYEDMPPVMSPRELAGILRTSVSTLARWRNDKVGPAWHQPRGVRMVRYSRVDVIAWLCESS